MLQGSGWLALFAHRRERGCADADGAGSARQVKPSKEAARRIHVRAARPNDMPAIRGLIRLFPNKLAQTNIPRASSFFVAESGGNVVGCCALQIYSKRIAEVRSLAVHPDFQDRGLASQLVRCCKERAQARGIREVFAVTSQVAFFERLGFTTFRRERTAMFFEISPER